MSAVFKSERHAAAVRAACTAALACWPADAQRVTVPTPAGETHHQPRFPAALWRHSGV